MDVLSGLRVLDLTTGVAGPVVGMFLADFGADVLKIETPDGDPARATAGFAMWNRGKRSVVVDPADESDMDWLGRQVVGADVLLTNGGLRGPGHRIDGLAQLALHPRLVVVELPPYVRAGTPWAGGHESAALLAALGGQSARQSSDSGDPVDLVYPTLLYLHGVWATVCTVAALIEREGSGAGQRVVVSGANALQVLMPGILVTDPDSPDPSTAIGAGGRHPTYSRMLARDGRWLALGALGAKFELAALEALGLAGLLDEERMGGRVQNLVVPGNIGWARGEVDKIFLTKDRAEWLAILEAAGIPCGPLDDREDWLDHPQVRAIGMRVEVDDPERGRVVMPGVPLNLSRTPGRVRGPAPMLGQHTRSTEAWRPSPAPDAGDLPPLRPGPLSGIRVLNCGTFVATPLAGYLLAELGADVVKVEPPSGDPFRVPGYVANRGMRSLAIDLKSPAGIEAFYDLVRTTDAVVDGLRPGVTETLGIDYPTLRRYKTDIITMSLSAYGEGGPLGGRGGVDMVVQAMSGMMTAQGGTDEPVANTIAICDMTTAAMSALTVCLALVHRIRTGEGQRTSDSLAATATFLQGGEITRFPNRPPSRIGGQDFKGDSAYDRMYRASDGWIRVHAGPSVADAAAAAAEALGLEASDLTEEDKAMSVIAEAVGTMTGEQAVAAFGSAGLAAVRVRNVSAVIRAPELLEEEFLHVYPAAAGGHLCAPGQLAVFSRTARYGVLKPPGTGEHTRDVLESAGLEPARIATLLAEGVVVQGGPMVHALPPPYR